jgi:hypothetical protein
MQWNDQEEDINMFVKILGSFNVRIEAIEHPELYQRLKVLTSG